MKLKKNIAVITPLALEKCEVEFHRSYMNNIRYLQSNTSKLPFEINKLHSISEPKEKPSTNNPIHISLPEPKNL